jgi:hypothetical protein
VEEQARHHGPLLVELQPLHELNASQAAQAKATAHASSQQQASLKQQAESLKLSWVRQLPPYSRVVLTTKLRQAVGDRCAKARS